MWAEDMALRYAQVDIGLFGDPKVRRLFRRLEVERAYAAIGLWLDILLTSWTDEKPVRASEVVDPEAHAELLDALSAVGLLDADQRIPASAFRKWFGPIEQQRERWRKNKANQRMSPEVPGGPRGHSVPEDIRSGIGPVPEDTRGHHEDTRGPSIPFSSIHLPSQEEEGESEGEPEDGLDLTYNRLTGGRVPSDRQLKWLRSMEKDHGLQTAIRTMEEVYRATMDPDELLPNTQQALQARRNETAKREEREREARQEQARLDRSRRAIRDLEEAKERSERADPRPLAEMMPDIASMFGGKDKHHD